MTVLIEVISYKISLNLKNNLNIYSLYYQAKNLKERRNLYLNQKNNSHQNKVVKKATNQNNNKKSPNNNQNNNSHKQNNNSNKMKDQNMNYHSLNQLSQ
jgi:hypothetical protein